MMAFAPAWGATCEGLASLSLPDTTITKAEIVPAATGGLPEYCRVDAMVPGMNHCAGGPGTDNFDMLGALERWVPYPQAAIYKGAGSTDDATNFTCKVR